MLKRIWRAIRPLLFWSYRRGSWQYDVVVALILAFIFLTPRSFFGDRPRPPQIRELESLSGPGGARVFWVDPRAVDAPSAADLERQLGELIGRSAGQGLRVVSAEPATDADGRVQAYLVRVQP